MTRSKSRALHSLQFSDGMKVMIPVATILFAIQAGVRLGSKVHQVLLDTAQERVLVMPMGDDLQGVQETEARMYFIEHQERPAPGGPYEGPQKEDRVKAFPQTLKNRGGGGETRCRKKKERKRRLWKKQWSKFGQRWLHRR